MWIPEVGRALGQKKEGDLKWGEGWRRKHRRIPSPKDTSLERTDTLYCLFLVCRTELGKQFSRNLKFLDIVTEDLKDLWVFLVRGGRGWSTDLPIILEELSLLIECVEETKNKEQFMWGPHPPGPASESCLGDEGKIGKENKSKACPVHTGGHPILCRCSKSPLWPFWQAEPGRSRCEPAVHCARTLQSTSRKPHSDPDLPRLLLTWSFINCQHFLIMLPPLAFCAPLTTGYHPKSLRPAGRFLVYTCLFMCIRVYGMHFHRKLRS